VCHRHPEIPYQLRYLKKEGRVIIDVFKIGISISATNGVSSVLKVIQRDLFGINKAVDFTQGKFDKLKLAIAGAMTASAGAGILYTLGKAVDYGDKLVHQQAQLRNQGLSASDVQKATTASFAATQSVPGTLVEDNLRVIGELRTQLGSTNAAIQLMPKFQELGLVLSNLTGKSADGQAYSAILAMDARGSIINRKTGEIDPSLAGPELDAMTRAIIASHGLLTADDFRNVARQSGPAGMAMSPEAFYGKLPTAMQVMGSQKAGTALMSLFQELATGVMPQRVGEQLLKLGLIDPKGYHVRRGGQVVIDPGSLKGESQFMNDPFKWINDTLKKAMQDKGIVDPKAQGNAVGSLIGPIVDEVGRVIGRQTAQRLVTEALLNAPQYQRDFEQRQKAFGIDAANANNQAQDPTQAMKNFQAAWSNLMTALGAPLVSSAVAMLNGVSASIENLALWASKHPTLVKVMGGFAAALGGVAIAFGAFAVGAVAFTALGALAGPAGLLALAAGIAALGAALPKIPKWVIAMATGAAAGAAAGTVIPGVGTVAGAVAGAALGGVAIAFGDHSENHTLIPHSLDRHSYGTYMRNLGQDQVTASHMRSRSAALPSNAPSRTIAMPINAPATPAAAPPQSSSQVMRTQSIVPPPPLAANNNGAPIPVHVVNGRDLVNGVTNAQARFYKGPLQGTTGTDARVTPPMPGSAAGQ
jgi:hypothetical protein